MLWQCSSYLTEFERFITEGKHRSCLYSGSLFVQLLPKNDVTPSNMLGASPGRKRDVETHFALTHQSHVAHQIIEQLEVGLELAASCSIIHFN